MAQSIDESAQTVRLSRTSKRQREGTDHVGAFGTRTGRSDLVFLEGMLPEASGTIVNDRSIEAQMSACFDRLEAVLASRGLDLSNVMKVTVQLTDTADRDVVDDVYRARFDGEYPPRTTMGVCSLPAGAAVQLDVIAAVE
ncbi:RidA family protein [Salinadaptatus halalkaliphilus]|uniref:RidA family protein n=1 Tax=Salinadaptatus halalkaliphilus TaxID=2419781 RepID=A0A4S3TKZ9_9EURY|nr:RidA family protein [Salinadaptatus halalkaliphilus]THE64726.1 RidA family protein [Salinadaptatus halalkaliphilus]